MLEVFDFLLKARDRQSLKKQVGEYDEPRQQRNVECGSHARVDSTTARADYWLWMLSRQEIDRKVIERNVQQRQQSEHARQRCPLLLIRQISSQHQIRHQRQ